MQLEKRGTFDTFVSNNVSNRLGPSQFFLEETALYSPNRHQWISLSHCLSKMIFASFCGCYGSNFMNNISLDLEKFPRPQTLWGYPNCKSEAPHFRRCWIAFWRCVPSCRGSLRNSQSRSKACNMIWRLGEGRGTMSGGVSSSKGGNGEPGLLHAALSRLISISLWVMSRFSSNQHP